VLVRAIVRGWPDDPETLPWLKIQLDSSEALVRQAAVLELAQNWPLGAETSMLLTAKAEGDPQSGRQANGFAKVSPGVDKSVSNFRVAEN
jgi:hypothetical protein